MEGNTKRINLSRYATVFVFALISIGALIAFGYYALDVVLGLIYREDIIEFNKGAMYMLGAGLSAGLLTFFMVHELKGREVSKSYNKKATRLAMIFIGFIFLFPQLVDYVISYKVRDIDYIFCENRSYQWLHAQNKVFGINDEACENFKTNKIIG
ncbi:MAG: hypothetical protein GQ546_03225 [Gammaproteobacteria bacterium]|nr:hypothetical protein [Gammaproteobacteria bacterium]